MRGHQGKVGVDVNLIGPQGMTGPDGRKGPALPRSLFDDSWRYRAAIAKIQRNHAQRAWKPQPGEFVLDPAPFCHEHIPWWKRFYYWLIGK